MLIFAIGIVTVFTGPSWFPIVAMGVLTLRWAAWEILIIGALVDLVWLPYGSFIHTPPLFSLAALVLLWGLGPLRRELLIQ